MQSTGFSSAVSPAHQDSTGPAANATTEAFKKLLTGSGSGQLNLRAVKERALALRRSLDEFIEILQFQPHRLTWEDSLDRFGVMGLRHQQLMQQIRPLLRFYIAHPKAVNQSNAELIPLLLSTMKLPEMEAEEKELAQGAAGGGSGPSSYEELGNSLESFNNLVDELTQHIHSDTASGVLDPKGPKRKAMAQELRTAVNNAESSTAAYRGLQVPLPFQSGDQAARALLEAAITGKGL